MRYFFCLIFAFSLSISTAYAFEGMDRGQLKEMAENFNLDRGQISSMIDLLERTGQITSAQAKEAKQELENYSDDDINALREQAVQKINQADSADELMPKNMLRNAPQGGDPASTSQSDEELDYRKTLESLGN